MTEILKYLLLNFLAPFDLTAGGHNESMSKSNYLELPNDKLRLKEPPENWLWDSYLDARRFKQVMSKIHIHAFITKKGL